MDRTQTRNVALALRLCVAMFVAFLAIAGHVQGSDAFKKFDSELADRLHEHALSTPVLTGVFHVITELGAFWTLTAFASVVALVLLIRGRYLLLVDWLLAMIGGGFFNLGLKVLFHRPRYVRIMVEEPSFSFPSGHSMGAVFVYGLAVFFLARALPPWVPRLPLVIGTTLMILLVGFSRLYLGAHYLSDVLGGFAAGAFWISLWIVLIELGRWQTRAGDLLEHQPEEADPKAG